MKCRLLCFVMVFVCAQAQAQPISTTQLSGSSVQGNISLWLTESLKFASNAHGALSNQLVTVSDKIDSFLGADRANEELNGTHLRLRQINTFFEDGAMTPTIGTIFKLDLPKTNKRLSLVVESQEDRGEGGERETVPVGQSIDNQVKSNTAVNSAIQLIIQDSEAWYVRAHVGVRFSDKAPNPNTKLRIRRLFSFEPWKFRITETLFWYLAEGWGETTLFELERPMVPTFFFRASNQSTWFIESNNLDYSQKFTIFHSIGEERLLYFEVGAYGRSQPSFHIGTYVASIHYRQLIYDDWLFVDFTPMAVFPKDDDFTFSPVVILALEMVIGATKKSAH